MPATLVDDRSAAVDGVATAEGALGGYAQLVDLQGDPLTTTGAPFIGVSWGHEEGLLPATLDVGPRRTASVRWRSTAGPPPTTASRWRRTTVLLADGTHPEVEIVGIFTFGDSNNLLGARLTAFDIDVAAQVFGAGDQVDSIGVARTRPSTVRAGGADPGRAPRAGVEAVTATQIAGEGQDAVAGFLGAFRNILLGFAGIALFVSAFFINNTFSIVVGQRTRSWRSCARSARAGSRSPGRSSARPWSSASWRPSSGSGSGS